MLVMAIVATMSVTTGCSRAPRAITIYRAYCPVTPNSDGQCPVHERAAVRIAYRAFPATQTVVYSTETSPPRRLTGCVVQDAKNWGCDLISAADEPKGPAIVTMPVSGKRVVVGSEVLALIRQKFRISMVDGIVHRKSESHLRFHQVSILQWYRLKFNIN